MLEIVEYFYVDLVVWSVLLEKFAETVCKIVTLSELEDRLVYLLAKPYYCLSDELRSPFARSYKPRSNIPCEKACGVLFDIE